MATRLMLLPLIEHQRPGRDPDTKLPYPPTYEVDTLGIEVEKAVIRSNYRDCGKVEVTAKSDRTLADLKAKVREHFTAQGWRFSDP